MAEDKLFDLLVARIQTRETSTLAIVIIAASTSLILLGFVCQIDVEQRTPLVIIGILYPILGMSFREIAYRTIQNHDLEQIKKHFSAEEVKIVLGGYHNLSRRIIFYLLFALLSLVLWVLVSAFKIC